MRNNPVIPSYNAFDHSQGHNLRALIGGLVIALVIMGQRDNVVTDATLFADSFEPSPTL